MTRAGSRDRTGQQPVRDRVEQLVDPSPAVVYCLEPVPPFRLTFVSENVSRRLGGTAAQMLADPAPLGGRLHPDDAGAFTAALAALPVAGRTVTEHRPARSRTWSPAVSAAPPRSPWTCPA